MNKPWSMQIELVEGCNRMCRFCGINGIWANPKHRKIKFASTMVMKQVAADISNWYSDGHGPRIEFAMHGEPTLHPELISIIKAFRLLLPATQLQLTSNAKRILHEPGLISNILDAGINILVLDTYDKSMIPLQEICKAENVEWFTYYENHECPNPYHNHGNTIRCVVLLDDIGEHTGERAARSIINHAGNVPQATLEALGVPKKDLPLAKTCSRVFREMNVHWDGSIPACCIDWKHELIMGQFPKDGSLSSIWNGQVFQAVRYILSQRDRRLRPCFKCDYNGGFRLGLLPPHEFTGTMDDALKLVSKAYNDYAQLAHPDADKVLIQDHVQKGFLW